MFRYHHFRHFSHHDALRTIIKLMCLKEVTILHWRYVGLYTKEKSINHIILEKKLLRNIDCYVCTYVYINVIVQFFSNLYICYENSKKKT